MRKIVISVILIACLVIALFVAYSFWPKVISNTGLFVTPEGITADGKNTVVMVYSSLSMGGWSVCDESFSAGTLKLTLKTGRKGWPAKVTVPAAKSEIKEILIVGRNNEDARKVFPE